MRPNHLRQLKAEGRPIINAWLSIGSSYAAESVAHQGFDAATIDCQHGMIGFETAITMLQAVSTTPSIPLARPSSMAAAEIMRLLDAGSYGIICPMIDDAADAAALVAACRYPPIGSRSCGPARGLLYGGSDYIAKANDEIIVLAMIETAAGLANLDAILAVPGLDGIYVGPNDLSAALGYPPRSESEVPAVVAAVERIRAATVQRGLIAGIFCSDGKAAAARIAQGFDLVTPGNDASLLRAVSASAVDDARSRS